MKHWSDAWDGAVDELEDALLDRESLNDGITADEHRLVSIIHRDRSFGPVAVREVVRVLRAGTEAIERERGIS